MLKLSIKNVVFIFLIAALLTGAFFWRNLFICSVEWYIGKYCQDKFEASFHAEAIHFDNGTIVVDHPSIVGEKPLKDGGVDFKAELLKIGIAPSFWNRQIDFDVEITRPNLTVKQTSTDIRAAINDLFPPSKYITVNSKINVSEGNIEFHDFKYDPPLRQKLYFQLNWECKQQNQGCVIVSLDDPGLKNNCVALSLAEMESRAFAMDFNFDAVNCATLLGAARNFFPPLQYLIAEEGIITGKMNLTVPETGRPYAQGTLTLQDVAFSMPAIELKGLVKEAHLHLLAAANSTGASPQTLGRLELTKEIALKFEKDGRHYCEINDLIGAINFESSESTTMNLEGKCTHHGQAANLAITGNARFGRDRGNEPDLDLSLRLSMPGKEDTTARFRTKTAEAQPQYAQVELGRFGPWDFDLLKMIFTPCFPNLSCVQMKEGCVDVSVLATLQGLRIGDLKLEKISAKGLRCTLDPWDLDVRIHDLAGELSVNLSTVDFLNTLNAELSISNAQACFSGRNSKACQLTNLQTKLSIQKGIIEKSVVQGMFAGLNGTIDLDGTSPRGELIKFDFKGKSPEILSLLPENFPEKIKKEFYDDNLSIFASLYLIDNGVKVEGNLNIRSDKERYGHTLEFGFELEKSSQELWNRWPPSELASSFWHQIGMEATIASMPAIASPAAFFKTHWLNRELGVAGLVLNSGWVQAQNLPLKKYVEHFMFPDGDIKLQGHGDLQASFDHCSAVINYDMRNASLESNDFSLEIKSLHALNEPDPTLPLPGTAFFDFNSASYYIILPVVEGTYFEKSSGLLFTNVNALAIMEGKRIHLRELTTACNGMGMAGKLDVDLSSPVKGEYDLDVHASAIHGTFSQLQHLFSHFEHLKFFQKFPLEGNLKLLDKEAYLHMGFSPDGLQIKSTIQGILTEGKATLHNADVELKGLQSKFEYDFEKHQLNFHDIHGALLIGKDDQTEEYIVAGDHFNFNDMEAKEADFDLWIGDQSRDIFRLVGKSALKQSPRSKDPLIEIAIDPESTHFGNVHPDKFELVLKNWNQVHYFDLHVGLQLETILYDLQLASRSGIFFLPQKALAELNKLKTANGELDIAVQYDDETSITACHLKGEDVLLGPYSFKKCSLHGKKNGSLWAIDQLLLDNISLAADLIRTPNSWKANFIGLRIGESILVGMEGEYSDGDEAIDAKVNLLEVNLESLKEIPAMAEFASKCSPKGIMRGTGSLHFELNKDGANSWQVDALFNSSFKTLELNGFNFQDIINASCHYVSDKGITFRQLKTALKDGKDGQALGQMHIEKIDYDFNKSELLVDGLHFNVPVNNLSYVSNLLHENFPSEINKKTAAILGHLKQKDTLEGSLNVTHSPAATNFQIALKEGSYNFAGQQHEINNFVLKYNLADLKVITQYRFKNNLFWLSLHTSAPDFNHGVIQLSDYYPDQHAKAAAQPALHVHWQSDEHRGLVINKAEGVLNGLHVHLHNDPEMASTKDALFLEGKVAFHAPKAAKFISEELSQTALGWQMGDGFSLVGKWMVGKHHTEQLSSQIHFNGMLEGSSIALKGYQFQSLSSEVYIKPHHIHFKQLKLEDPAGQLRIEQGNIVETPEGEWMLQIPMVHVSEFRPSLLKEPGEVDEKQGKALVIRHFELENLSGNLTDSNTLTGKGKLQFLNPPKKNLQNTIFAIPGEILTMLGLDLTVLNPVSGTIFYEVKDGKAYLTKFKDVYSEGKLSKFNLSHSGSPSYVDFDGNVQMLIRMKQYNLFFKLAELFTVNVGGTLYKPTYSLQKQTSNKDTADK